MAVDKDIEGDQVVDCLGSAIYHGEAELGDVPGLLKRVIEEGFWRRRVLRKTGQIVEFSRFLDFVREGPPEGLGTTLKTLQRICQDDKAVLDMLDRETVQGPGGDKRSEAAQETTVDNINNDSDSKRASNGTSATYALRKLRTARPDLHEQVLSNALSPHAAMIEAGFRQRSITIAVDPAGAARRIRKNFSDKQIVELIDLLQKESEYPP